MSRLLSTIDRLLTTLDRHGVDFLLVGGVAAIAYGARRPTAHLDCVARRSRANLDRLAVALRSLNARLRVHGLTDEEGSTAADAHRQGHVGPDGDFHLANGRAGDFDVLTDLARP